SYSDYRDLMDLTETLIKRLAERVLGKLEIEFDGKTISLQNWRRLSLKESIMEHWPESSTPKPSLADLDDPSRIEALCKQWNLFAAGHSLQTVSLRQDLSSGELLGELFETVVEEHLVQPTLIYDYPIELSPLSKTKPQDPSLVQRIELYLGSTEIANAYSELNEPEEQ